VLSRINDMLHALHLGNPTPITDPYPSLRFGFIGPPRSVASTRRGRGTHISTSGHEEETWGTGCRYRSGRIWVPDTYSLGPAPALLAGAQFTQFLTWMSNEVGWGGKSPPWFVHKPFKYYGTVRWM
jgi:hypothetical protein